MLLSLFLVFKENLFILISLVCFSNEFSNSFISKRSLLFLAYQNFFGLWVGNILIVCLAFYPPIYLFILLFAFSLSEINVLLI